ncbi:MAG: PD-(D/E)XK nuclease family protein [Candidatus Sungbacteria bacterium]|uniref:PD-(D/E)XK nuclease family protein n=1 Tax=Candidatus Sungiibacteriota bacterium TaxID=2750080 RepID=A0A9D6QVB5_9BACT|nr:PD-(D/E)XK nuclease family protein [Candidatus Sungbacteria bacterium]
MPSKPSASRSDRASRGEAKKKTWLSHTGLEGFERCPRCFWLQYNKKIRQPEGIVSRLANRFDRLFKAYFNAYRPELPPIIKGKITGHLEQPFTETYFFHVDNDFGFYGNLDECIVEEDGSRTPVDHKTSTSDPRKEKALIPAYQAQLDSYAFLLEQNGKPTSGRGHLIYYYPDDSLEMHNGVPLAVVIKTLETHPANTIQRIQRGIEVLKSEIPEPSLDCPFCTWRKTLDLL